VHRMLALVLAAGLVIPALAQATLTDDDMQRLEAARQQGPPRGDRSRADRPRSPYGEERAGPRGPFRRFTGMMESARGLGPWEEQQAYIMDATERIYERNGWTSEPDQFSLHMMREVNEVPPWQPQARFERMVGLLSERYDLDDQQQRKLQELMAREMQNMFQNHGPRVMQYTMEAIQTRAAGDAFTPEQVARWSEMAQPVFEDARVRFDQAAEEFIQTLRPEQQEVVRVDLEANRTRQDTFIAMGERWRRGEWQASDWGLEADPIQVAGEMRRAAGEVPDAPSMPPPGEFGPGAPPPPPGFTPEAQNQQPDDVPDAPDMAERGPTRRGPGGPPVAGPGTPGEGPPGPAQRGRRGPAGAQAAADSDPWAKYVREFIARYKLNEDQEAAAWRSYQDLHPRGEQIRKRYQEQTDALKSRLASEPERQAAAVKEHERAQQAALDKVFEQLKARLERLPTSAQRAAANPPREQKP
jgi:hypothetical protein